MASLCFSIVRFVAESPAFQKSVCARVNCKGCIYVFHLFTEIYRAKIFHRLGTQLKFDNSSGINVTATRGYACSHNYW